MTPTQERIWLLTEVREQSRLIGNLCCAICKRAIRANEDGEVTMADRAEARCGEVDCVAPIYAGLSIGIVNYAAFDMLRSVVAIWRAAPRTEGGTILHICADRIETILDLAGHPRERNRP